MKQSHLGEAHSGHFDDEQLGPTAEGAIDEAGFRLVGGVLEAVEGGLAVEVVEELGAEDVAVFFAFRLGSGIDELGFRMLGEESLGFVRCEFFDASREDDRWRFEFGHGLRRGFTPEDEKWQDERQKAHARRETGKCRLLNVDC